jgi:hypothetical protein
MKTLKQFLEVYEPKSPDEKKFKDKHVTIKHDDRNGNGDDVFQATNVKKAERKKERHGYEPGEDEKVYEEVDLDEKTLTPAEMKKREEVAKAIERENPNMPMAKKMAIATSTAKKVAEDIAFKAAKKYGTRIEEETDVEEVTAVDVVAEAFETNAVPKMFQPALLAIFEQLSEENQDKFATQLLTPEGIESLINFAIQNRGE